MPVTARAVRDGLRSLQPSTARASELYAALKVTVDIERTLSRTQDRPSLMLIATDRSDDPRTRRLTIAGEMDALGATRLHWAVIDALCRRRPAYLEINLRGLIFLDFPGVTVLRLCHAEAVRVRCRLTLTDPHPLVYPAIKLAGLSCQFSTDGMSPWAAGSTPATTGLLGSL
jgi:anti-anti-sigma regulatory factor